jgi:hypothetical protein
MHSKACVKGRAQELVRATCEFLDGERKELHTSFYAFEYDVKEEK